MEDVDFCLHPPFFKAFKNEKTIIIPFNLEKIELLIFCLIGFFMISLSIFGSVFGRSVRSILELIPTSSKRVNGENN